ncbi:MAG TPA: hypothetical protein VGA67_05385 [Candidatus Dojkabacteria bacterium]|jgi:hypothetical protein
MTISKKSLKKFGVVTFVIGLVLLLAAPVRAAVGEWSSSGSTIYYNDGRIGVGTSTPTQLLELKSSTESAAVRYHIPGVSHYVMGIDDADGKFKLNYSSDFSYGYNLMSVLENGNVGIGTEFPAQMLELRKSGGDTAMRYHIPGQSHFTTGIDATDNAFQISPGANLDGASRFKIESNGNICIGNC